MEQENKIKIAIVSLILLINNSETIELSFLLLSIPSNKILILSRYNIDFLHITIFYQYLTHDLLD